MKQIMCCEQPSRIKCSTSPNHLLGSEIGDR